jgi:hypothetical protein
MKSIKDELQHIILRDESAGEGSQLKKIQNFLSRHAETGFVSKKQEQFKGKETAAILTYAANHHLFYKKPINGNDFLTEGAEQRVYRLDDRQPKLTRTSF